MTFALARELDFLSSIVRAQLENPTRKTINFDDLQGKLLELEELVQILLDQTKCTVNVSPTKKVKPKISKLPCKKRLK
jgi:hypothetical protein